MKGLSDGLAEGFGTFAAHHLLLSNCAVGPDLSRIEANLCVAEDVTLKHESGNWSHDTDERAYRKDVNEAHDNDHDARSNDDPPECQTERFLASRFLVEIS